MQKWNISKKKQEWSQWCVSCRAKVYYRTDLTGTRGKMVTFMQIIRELRLFWKERQKPQRRICPYSKKGCKWRIQVAYINTSVQKKFIIKRVVSGKYLQVQTQILLQTMHGIWALKWQWLVHDEITGKHSYISKAVGCLHILKSEMTDIFPYIFRTACIFSLQ